MFTFKLRGTVSREPTVFNLKDGRMVATVSLACPIAKGKEGAVMFADLKAWSPMAERLAALKKGQRVFAEGEGITDIFEKDGKKNYKTAFWPYFFVSDEDDAGAIDSAPQKSAASAPVAKVATTTSTKGLGENDDVPF